MRRALIAAGACVLALALPGQVAAYPPITCGRATVGTVTVVVQSHGPTCRFAIHYVKVFLGHNHGPKGFRCRSYGVSVPAYCISTSKKKSRKNQYFFGNAAAA